jgi:transposase
MLPRFLARGPEAYDFVGPVWTGPRVAVVIEREFGVRYHPDHVRRLLIAIGWSYQKVELRAVQRDEPRIEQWVRHRWPAVKKKPERKAESSSSSTKPPSI